MGHKSLLVKQSSAVTRPCRNDEAYGVKPSSAAMSIIRRPAALRPYLQIIRALNPAASAWLLDYPRKCHATEPSTVGACWKQKAKWPTIKLRQKADSVEAYDRYT